ncbi:MAG: hypothetical protein MJ153_01375 [Clostridia bacterium]|nr:hypothetical protein [Clostridia bacterium]
MLYQKSKFFSFILSAILLLNISGCSEFMDYYAMNKLTDFTDYAIEDMNTDIVQGLINYSKAEIEIPELHDEQQELFDYAMDKAEISVESLNIHDGRKQAACKAIVSYVDFASIVDTLPSAEAEEYKAEIDNSDFRHRTVRLLIEFDRDGLYFKDLSDIAEVLFRGYEEALLTDENGMPLYFDSNYLTSIYVGSCWLDDFRSNPVSELCSSMEGGGEGSCTVESSDTLRAEFYFSQLINADISVELYKDDELYLSYVSELKKQSTVLADFSSFDNGNKSFDSGNYYIIIRVNDSIEIKSNICSVR